MAKAFALAGLTGDNLTTVGVLSKPVSFAGIIPRVLFTYSFISLREHLCYVRIKCDKTTLASLFRQDCPDDETLRDVKSFKQLISNRYPEIISLLADHRLFFYSRLTNKFCIAVCLLLPGRHQKFSLYTINNYWHCKESPACIICCFKSDVCCRWVKTNDH
jgi:hypothetical protein